jgi:hypothetical protein
MQISYPVWSIPHPCAWSSLPHDHRYRVMVIEGNHDDVHLLDMACQALSLPCAFEC